MKHLFDKICIALFLFALSCVFNFQNSQANPSDSTLFHITQMPDDAKQGYVHETTLGRSCDNLGPSFPAWGTWKPTRWKNIDYRLRCECEPNKSERPTRYMWWVQFQSRYPQRVNLSYDLVEKDVPHPDFHNRWHYSSEPIKGRRDERGDNWFLLKTPCNGNVTLWLGQLVLGNDDDLNGPFITPDN